MKTVGILVISLAIAVSFTGCKKDEFTLEILDDIDYEIYSLILDERFPDVKFSNIEFTVRQETLLWAIIPMKSEINLNSTFERLISLADADTSVFIDYISKNERIHNLDSNKFKVAGKVVILISPEELEDYFDDWFHWDWFYDKYPDSDGLIVFTRIGYNSDKSQAIVGFEDVGGGRNGEGYFVYITKNNDNEWEIILWNLIWIS